MPATARPMSFIPKAVSPPALLSILCVLAAARLAGQTAPPVTWTTSLQTGFADTFQLTLGGTFGEGPGWQNRVTTGLSNVLRAGDSIAVYGADAFDVPSHVNNWQAGVGYKTQVIKKPNHSLTLGSGLQHWRFPNVKTGAHDWLIPGNLIYQTRIGKLPFVVNSDSWTILSSPMTRGSVLHTQTWLQHALLNRDRVRVTFSHGPAHTYSWNFWGANGHRVLRYQTMLAIRLKNTSIEGGYRKQWGLQRGIRNNGYWQFALTRTFSIALHR
jgi:hypothetical protein